MRAKDLMVGDWVFNKEKKKEQITSLYDGYLCTETHEDSHDYYFKPIPLTEKILRGNGFVGGEFYGELLVNGWQVMCDCEHLAARHEDGWVVDVPCEYVHELQHALRLCGIEKEITL